MVDMAGKIIHDVEESGVFSDDEEDEALAMSRRLFTTRRRFQAALGTSARNLCFYGVLAGFLLVCWSGVFSIGTLHVQSSRGPRTNVLIVSYFRAGSSILADLLSSYHNAIYWEEPLLPLSSTWRVIKNNQALRHQSQRDDTVFNSMQAKDLDRVHAVLASIFACDISEVEKIHGDILYWSLGNRFQSTFTYTETIMSFLMTPFRGHISLTRMKCCQSPINVVRSTRVRLRHIEPFIREYPEVKVILVFRDPRAIIGSWAKMNIINEFSATNRELIRRFCQSISIDSKDYHILSRKYDQNLITVKIEDLIETPQFIFNQIKNFLGLQNRDTYLSSSLPDEVKSDIYFESYNPWNETFNRSLISLLPELSEETLQFMDKECKHALVKLEYDTFN